MTKTRLWLFAKFTNSEDVTHFMFIDERGVVKNKKKKHEKALEKHVLLSKSYANQVIKVVFCQQWVNKERKISF